MAEAEEDEYLNYANTKQAGSFLYRGEIGTDNPNPRRIIVDQTVSRIGY